jgi:Ca2+-binding EF-hand superfamily protein
VRKIFRAIDRDNNGSLECPELERLLVLLGIRVSSFEMTEIFNFIDENQNGHVSFDEFYAW